MQNLGLSPDDKRALSYTNNNQVIICTITTGEFTVLEQPVNALDNIIGKVIIGNEKYECYRLHACGYTGLSNNHLNQEVGVRGQCVIGL